MLTQSDWNHRLNKEIHEVMECADLDTMDKERLLLDIRKTIQALNELVWAQPSLWPSPDDLIRSTTDSTSG